MVVVASGLLGLVSTRMEHPPNKQARTRAIKASISSIGHTQGIAPILKVGVGQKELQTSLPHSTES